MSQKKSYTTILFFAAILLIPILGVTAYTLVEKASPLPILSQQVENENGEKEYKSITNYEFTNQEGEQVGNTELRGKIYIANFFFTSCPSICPQMTSQLYRVQEEFADIEDDVYILSHSVDPVRDSVPKLEAFAEQYNIDPAKWSLLTGDKKELYSLARNEYMVTALEGDGGPEDFIHSEMLILIDREGRIRGYYDGTESDEVDELIKDVKSLLKNS